MSSPGFFHGSILVLALLGSACAPRPDQSPGTDGYGSAGGTAGLADSVIRNAEYRIEFGSVKRVRLANGRFDDPENHVSAILLQTLPGDLDGDDAEDAVVLIGSSGSASGSLTHIVPVLNRGRAVTGAATLLGDRIQLQAISLGDRTVVIEMITQGPKDPMCCPTQHVRQSYRLQGDSLAILP
jgi:hypothetical protein